MSILKLSKKDIQKNGEDDKKIKLSRSQISYDSAMVSDWETRNKEAYDALESYRQRINSGGYLSADDLSSYRTALDSYVETSTGLRGISKVFGQGDMDDDTAWADTISQMETGYKGISDYFSQWDTEDAYNAWNQRESFINSYLEDPQKATATMDYQKDWLKEAELRAETRRVLGSEDFGENSKYASTEADDLWEKMWSTYGLGYNDLAYEYINNQNGIRSEIKGKHASFSAGGDLKYEERGYDYMTAEEVGVYNYYYRTEGKERAQAYLDAIEDSLVMRKAGKEFSAMEGKPLREYLYGIVAGTEQFASGIKNIGSLITGDQGFTPSSQYVSGLIRNDLADDGFKILGSSVGQIGYDIVNTTANMLPSILIGAATGGAGGALSMGTSATGNAYEQMMNLGYDKNQARAYSVLVGASEAGLQYLLGGISKLGGKLSGNVVSKLVSKVDNALAKVAITLGGNMLSEGAEEAVQSVLEPVFKSFVTGEDFEGVDLEEVLYSGLLGALSAGFLESGGTVAGNIITNADAKQTYGGFQQEMVGEALEINPDNAFAQKMQGRLDKGKNLSGSQLNRPVQQNEATLTAQDLSNIQSAAESRLAELGETGNVSIIAAALTKQATGEKLSRAEQQAIANSKFAQRVANEMNPENIRSGDYSSAWAEQIDTNRINAHEYSRLVEAAQLPQGGLEATGGKNVAEAPNTAQVQQAEPVTSSTETTTDIATSDESSVTADGVTRQVSSGQEVTPKRIASISGGKVMIATDSGTVSADDIEFGDTDTDMLWRSATQFQGINVAGANGIIHAYRSGQPVATYLHGAAQEFRNGYYNMESGGEYADKLTPSQRKIIYELGQKAAGENAAKAQAVAKNATTMKKGAAAKKSSETADKKEAVGTVHFDRKGRTFDQKRETALKMMEQLSKVLGVEFYVFESYVNEAGERVYKDTDGNEKHAPNGYYDPKDGSIHIDLNAGTDGKGTMLFTIAHELTHFIKQWSPAKFKVLANFLITQYGKKGVSVEELVETQIAKANKNGRTIDYDAAFEEVVADSMEAMLVSGNVVQMMAELKQLDKTLWQKICEWFKDLVADLKAVADAYKDHKPDSVEGRMIADMQDVIVILESLYTDALTNAAENYQSTKTEKNTSKEGGEAMFSLRGENKDGIEVYETSEEIKRLPYKERQQRFLEIMANEFRGRTAKFIRNGHAYYATFDEKDVNKNIYGDKLSDSKGWKAKINVGADGNIFELVENAQYNGSLSEKGKKIAAHRGVGYWDYFIKNVQIDDTVYDLVANVRKKTDGAYIYSIQLNQNKTIEASPPRGSLLRALSGVPNASKQNVAQDADDVKEKFSDRDSSYIDAVSRGDMEAAQQMVDEAAKAAGYTVKAHHGTSNDFWTFKKGNKRTRGTLNFGNGFYFSPSRSFAENYTSTGRVIDAFLKLDNPYTIYGTRFYTSDLERISAQTGMDVTSDNVNEVLQTNGYDGIIARDYNGTTNPVNQYVIFDAEQAKSADPVTYDDQGDVIPLSQRFEQGKSDIRYSERNPDLEKVNRVLEKENAELKGDVSYLKELLRLQKTVTGGTKFTKTSVEAAAGQLMKYADARGNKTELAKLLSSLYEYIAKGEELTWDWVKEAAQPAVEWLQSHTNTRKQTNGYAGDILREIRSSRVSLDASQKEEAAYQFGSYNEFRKKAMGSVIVADQGAIPLDSQWQEWSSLYPNIFDPETTSTDMPAALLNAVDRLRRMRETDTYGYDKELFGQDLLRQVYDSYWNVSTLYTVADKAQKDINRLKLEHSKRMSDLRQFHKEKTAQLKAEHREALQKVKREQQERLDRKLQQTKEQYQQSREKNAENRRKAEMRKKIRRTILDLDKLLNKGDKKRNVKEDMKGFASKALELADYIFTDHISNEELIRKGITVRMTPKEAALVKETEDILTRLYDNIGDLTGEEFARLDEKRKRNMEKLRDLLTEQRNEMLKTPVYNLFNDLLTEYASLKNSKQDAVKAAYDPNVESFLRSYIGESNGETDPDRKALLQNMRVADMTTAELERLYYAYKMVLHSVREANKLHIKGKNESIDQVVTQIVMDFGSRKIPEKKVAIALQKLTNKLGWDYEKLYYALDRIGSEAFADLIMNVANSENIVMNDIMEAVAFRDEMVGKYDFNNWAVNKEIDREFMDNSGKKFKMTLGQLMSLYAYSRREGAWDHIEYGGFVFGEAALTNPKPADSYKLNKAQCEAITNTLTKEQKGYVEDMQKFLSETMGEKGNEVSMMLYGIKMFGEKNYFPIHIAGQFKAQAQESQAKQAAGFGSMSNAGFTHAQNPNAKAPFVLEGFNEIWADHVNEMSRYHGTVPALEDLRRVMNRSSYSDSIAESTSVKVIMENHFGKEAVAYFDNLYREANSGAITDKLEKNSKWLLSKFRKNSVAYSLSVLIQQPASIVRAYALVDKKYFGYKGVGAISSGIGKAVSDKWTKAHTNAYNEMLKYAPGVTMAKEIGGFDTATGGSIRSYLLDTNKSLKQKWRTGTVTEKGKAALDFVDNNAIANLPNVADKIAWIEIWNACKRETVAKHKNLAPNSEEFMQAVGERFTEVIRATQVYDSIFAKSPMLKSKRIYVQMLVSFMNEPNTVANMAESAVRDATRGDWKGGVKKAAVLIHSIIFTNVLKSIIYAMRDDDEDETYIEKYIESLSGGIMNDFNALNYIPLLRDVVSVAQGYDVERADMAIAADLIDAIEKVYKYANTETEDMTEEELIEHDKKVTEANWKLVESLASFFGIPVKNIRREINGVIDHAKIASANKGQTTMLSAWDKIYDTVIESIPFMKNERTKGDKLYDAIVSGDKAYLDRLKSTYKTDYAYQSAVRNALRENDSRIHDAAQAKVDGNFDVYRKLLRQIQDEGKFDPDDIMSAIKSEESAIRKATKTTN